MKKRRILLERIGCMQTKSTWGVAMTQKVPKAGIDMSTDPRMKAATIWISRIE